MSNAFSLVPVGDAFVYRRAHDARHNAPPRRRRVAATRPAPAVAAKPVATVRPAADLAPRARQVRSATADTGGLAHLAAAREHLAGGDYSAAVRAAEAAVEADSLLAPAYVLLGRARTTLGQDAAAVDSLRKAVYLDPTAGDAHFLLAGALARLGHHGAAAVSYRAAAASLGRTDARSRATCSAGATWPSSSTCASSWPTARSRARRSGGVRRTGGVVMSGWVMFVLGGREMAGALDEVREVVRATGIEGLAGTRAPVTGLLELRGAPVPVVDLRSAADPADSGDILVLSTPRESSASRSTGCRRCSARTSCSRRRRPSPGRTACRRTSSRSAGTPTARPVLVVSLPALAGLVSA